MAFLKEKGISMLDWPGSSPDLNPFRNLWSAKKKLRDDHTVTSLKKLQDAITRMCVLMPDDLMMKLMHSMPKD